jgi:MFS superfamily sulfate permease-like transporter
MLLSIPQEIRDANPQIALIGGLSLLILFGLPFIKNKYVKRIPAPMVVVLLAVPLGMYFDLSHEHTYSFADHKYPVGEDFLVKVPDNMLSAVTLPDFSGLATLKGWKWVLMFALIGSLESLLSAKAVDTIDPYRRKTNLDRDLLAIGVGNTAAAFVGGLPMISEIVRSRANIDNGARTRFADLFHGLFLLAFVALVPWLIHRIPLAALGAMLVYTGFRLASPREWVGAYKVGPGQLIVFAATVIGVLATDLLIGIGIGIATELLIHLLNYQPLWSLVRPEVTVEEADPKTYVVRVHHAAVFSNWLLLRTRVNRLDPSRDVVLDLSETHLVDRTVMEKLHDLEKEFAAKGRKLTVAGLEGHRKVSDHPHAARTRGSRLIEAPGPNGTAVAPPGPEATPTPAPASPAATGPGAVSDP